MSIIMFIMAMLPVLILGLYIYSKDTEKEPKKLLAKLFFGGILSAVLTVILTLIFARSTFSTDISDYSIMRLLIHTFIEVALIEEISKFILTYFLAYNNKEFDQLYDMIVYAVFVSLGFAWIENVLYVFENGMATAIYRMFFAVPIHASVAVFMGYYLSLAKLAQTNKEKKTKYIYLSIIVPVLIHGLYDFLIYINYYIVLIIMFVFVGLVYSKANKKIKDMSKIKKSFLVKYCGECGTKLNGDYCSNCGRDATKDRI